MVFSLFLSLFHLNTFFHLFARYLCSNHANVPCWKNQTQRRLNKYTSAARLGINPMPSAPKWRTSARAVVYKIITLACVFVRAARGPGIGSQRLCERSEAAERQRKNIIFHANNHFNTAMRGEWKRVTTAGKWEKWHGNMWQKLAPTLRPPWHHSATLVPTKQCGPQSNKYNVVRCALIDAISTIRTAMLARLTRAYSMPLILLGAGPKSRRLSNLLGATRPGLPRLFLII